MRGTSVHNTSQYNWSRTTNIDSTLIVPENCYRSFTTENCYRSFTKHLDRLKCNVSLEVPILTSEATRLSYNDRVVFKSVYSCQTLRAISYGWYISPEHLHFLYIHAWHIIAHCHTLYLSRALRTSNSLSELSSMTLLDSSCERANLEDNHIKS